MSTHKMTWKAWVEKISPINSVASNIEPGLRDAMVEALCLAAPQGPLGFRCIDACDCDARFHSTALLDELLRRGMKVPTAGQLRPLEILQAGLERAIVSDSANNRGKPFPMRELVDHYVFVKASNTKVVVARDQWPHVWALIQEQDFI